jgi:tetratricopeptide (TPR) repeat protein
MSSVQTDSRIDSAAALLVEELVDNLQAGEGDVEDFIAAHPDQAATLRRLLPALRVMADLSHSAEDEHRTSGNDPAALGQLGDFSIIREIGRGGMGIVYEAEQLSLGRRVALKVLPFAATMDSRQLQRFHNEARAAAGLHHPNIVPVFGVGQERGVHYYAMQFIDGQTLADIIGLQRNEPATGRNTDEAAAGSASTVPLAALATSAAPKDAAYFRRAAEWGIQAAEALDCAHSLGIVHRDVKPANLLIDDAGKLWVTDFGLAQVRSDSRITMTGDLVGTLRYMSPDQALGQRMVIDHRTDVYSLGATLYELLTLQPVFEGNDRHELLRQIAFNEPQPLRRINRAIPAELEIIVLKALEKNPQERYGTAKELGEDLARYLRDESIQARRPTLFVRGRKWARRRRALVAAGAVCLGVILAAAIGSASWILGERSARQRDAEAKVQEALDQAAPLLEQGNPWDPALVSAVQRAEAQRDSAPINPVMRKGVEQLLRDVEMLRRLEDASLQASDGGEDGFDLSTAKRLFGEAFAWYGVDVTDTLLAAEVVRASVISDHLIAALDAWAEMKNDFQKSSERKEWKIAHLVDDDSWRRTLRGAIIGKDRAALEALANSKGVLNQPSGNLVRLSVALFRFDSFATVERMLRSAYPRQRADFWINLMLADSLSRKKPPDYSEAARFYQAALAVRPKSAPVCKSLGNALHKLGRLAEAEAIHRKAVELQPNDGGNHNNLGVALNGQERWAEAEKAFRKAIELKPDWATPHQNLGVALSKLGQRDEAIRETREAIRLDPKNPKRQNDFGILLLDQGRTNDAIECFRKALRMDPQFADAHNSLGKALLDKKGQLDAAIRHFRLAIEYDPTQALPHYNLGCAHSRQGNLIAAIRQWRLAIEINPKHFNAHNNLGTALREKGELDEAIHQLRLAIEIGPKVAMGHYNLGGALYAKGDLDEAIREFRLAIKCDPNYADAFTNLGSAYMAQGNLSEATVYFEKALELKGANDSEAHWNLGVAMRFQARFPDSLKSYKRAHQIGSPSANISRRYAEGVRSAERLIELDAKLPRFLNGETEPGDVGERLALAQMCQEYKRFYFAAYRFYRDALAQQPGLAGDLQKQPRYNAACAAVLASGGQGKDADQADLKERTNLREKALHWLREDLAAYRQILTKEPDKAGPLVRQRMQHWQRDKDFASVRGDALAKLSTAERESWQQLWSAVAQTLAESKGTSDPAKKSDMK